jgi:HlyD family secretion protein
MLKQKIPLIFIVSFLIIGGLAWYVYQNSNNNKLVASGTIEAVEVVVSSQVPGTVSRINVAEGDSLQEGAVIAELDAGRLEQALKSAQSKYKIASDDLERMKKLYADKMVSPQQYEMALANFQMAEAALADARIQHNDAVIAAPISGVILVKAVEKGELASVGTPVVTMADLRVLNLMVYLPEKDVGKVSLGEEVMVSVDSFPGRKFAGKLIYISDRAEFTPKSIQTKDERVTQVFGVKVEIPNPGRELKPGMPADAEFPWAPQ